MMKRARITQTNAMTIKLGVTRTTFCIRDICFSDISFIRAKVGLICRGRTLCHVRSELSTRSRAVLVPQPGPYIALLIPHLARHLLSTVLGRLIEGVILNLSLE